ncbi:MAG: YceI family protein [Ferruginibacter sp.]|nr:YceI family protein [Ferruginibacter sp.]
MNNHNYLRHDALPIILFLIASLFLGGRQIKSELNRPNVVRWVVEKNSSLQVAGMSNVNEFSCNIREYAAKDTITCSDEPAKTITLSGELEMDIMSFNCNSNVITKDLRKTLKAETYPTFNIRFLSLQSMPALLRKTELIKGCLEVELAGVVKKFELNYTFTAIGAGYIKLTGSHRFCFSDFNLSPPRKLAGLIKIKDEFDVSFQLILRSL